MWKIKYLVAIVVLCCQTTGILSNPDERVARYPQWILELKIGNSHMRPIINERSSICNCGSSLDSSSVQRESVQTSVVEKARPTLPTLNLNGSDYYFELTQKMTYFGAMEFCKQHKMELLSIETEAENVRIMNYIKNNAKQIDHFWTSGNDLNVEGRYTWLSTGQPFSFIGWKPPVPDNEGDEDCVEIRDFGGDNYAWNDMKCMLSLNFICEA